MSISKEADILKELQELRRDVNRIEQALAKPQQHIQLKKGEQRPELRVFVTKTSEGRKPYLFIFKGVLKTNVRLSSVRAAILLVLLLDLQDRTEEGGRGVLDELDAITKVLHIFGEGSENETQLQNNVRVALYRFESFCNEGKEFSSENGRLIFSNKRNRLDFLSPKGQKPVDNLKLELTTNDSLVATALDQTLLTSPIARVRRRGAVCIPEGPEEFDRLVTELYDHRWKVDVATLYFRPAFISYPQSLLNAMDSSEAVLRRSSIVHSEAYAEKRLSYLEILNYEAIWNLIRLSQDGSFNNYPKQIETPQVVEHLEYLEFLVSSYETYKLTLTDATFPFYIGQYEIHTSEVPEVFTTFFTRFSLENQHDVSSFVITDQTVASSIRSSVIDWVLDHPSTVDSRNIILDTLKQIREHLINKGPLAPDAPSLR